MRFERCVLHIGTEKTGTTSLQSFLALNRRRLAGGGFFVPTSLSPRQAIANHERLTTFSLREGKLGDDLRQSAGLATVDDVHAHRRKVRDEFLSEIGNAAPLPSTLLLSNEHCHSRLIHADEVETLRDFLRAFADTVQVIVYLRPQHQLAISLYNQALRVGYHDINALPDFSGTERRWVERRYFDYNDLLSRWSAVFGRANIRPRIFDTARFANGSVTDDFMGVIGVADPALVRPKDINKSFSADVQPALNALNRYWKSGRTGTTPKIRARAVGLLESLSRGGAAQPARADALAFYAQFAGGNELVRKEYFPDRAALFDDDFSRYPEAPAPSVSEAESLVQVLSAILASDSPLKM